MFAAGGERYLNSEGGERHSWLSGLPGRVTPEGSMEASSGILLSWKTAAAEVLCSRDLLHMLFLCAVNILHGLVHRAQVLGVAELQLCVGDVVSAREL